MVCVARNNVIPEILVNLSNRERNTHSLTTLTGRYSTTKELCRDFGSAAVPFARKAAGRGTGVHVIQQALLYSPLTSAATPQACVLILLRAFYLSSLAVVGVALLGGTNNAEWSHHEPSNKGNYCKVYTHSRETRCLSNYKLWQLQGVVLRLPPAIVEDATKTDEEQAGDMVPS